MSTNYPINPRVRAFGKARIDIAERAKNPADWEKLWKYPSNSFPFVWGESWKQCVEYRVDDFAAEVGFFIDVLGLPVNAFDPSYAMFTSPKGDFFFAVVPTPPAERSTPPDAIRLQFMVEDVMATTHELEQRGIFFEQAPQPLRPGSSLFIGYFRTPHGICVELWGTIKAATSSNMYVSVAKNLAKRENGDESNEDDEDVEEDDSGDNGDEEDEELGQNGDGGDGDSEDEFTEDDEDDDLAEDEEDDDEEDEYDDDDDEDDFDEDDRSTTLKSNSRNANPSYSPTLSKDIKLNKQSKMVADENCHDLEYFDIDAT